MVKFPFEMYIKIESYQRESYLLHCLFDCVCVFVLFCLFFFLFVFFFVSFFKVSFTYIASKILHRFTGKCVIYS